MALKRNVGFLGGRIIKPMSEGGMGIRALKYFMEALHAKMIWNIITTESFFGCLYEF